MSEGVKRIAAERARQVTQEQWSPEHDDSHRRGELAWAAVCYAAPDEVYRHARGHSGHRFTDPWPWEHRWDKRILEPTIDEDIRMLVKAGALVAAEIDRLLRTRHE